jgi:hypothetical protein
MPGSLVPGDIERIADHLGVEISEEWVKKHFLASDGARAIIGGQPVQVGTIVPAQQADGKCVFLDDGGRCKVHPVAPFNCAYQDQHISDRESQQRSVVAIRRQANSREYRTVHKWLFDQGKMAKPLVERRQAFEAKMREVRRTD